MVAVRWGSVTIHRYRSIFALTYLAGLEGTLFKPVALTIVLPCFALDLVLNGYSCLGVYADLKCNDSGDLVSFTGPPDALRRPLLNTLAPPSPRSLNLMCILLP